MWTIALEVRTKGGLITKTVDGSTFTRLHTPTTLVEVLYDQEKDSVEWAILELLYVFNYVSEEIDYIKIIKSWKNESDIKSDGYKHSSESSTMD